MSLADIEFANNSEPRCPVLLLLDTSGSMFGDKIRQLNQGIFTFKEEIIKDDVAKKRVEIAIVSFGGEVSLCQDFVTVEKFIPSQLTTNGSTPMGRAIEYGLDLVESRKVVYKESGIPFYRPWVFLITDGFPTDNWENAAIKVKQYEESNKITLFAVGVESADMDTLAQISQNTPPVMLRGLSFSEMFIWLSNSMSQVSTSQTNTQVNLPPIGSWAVAPA